MMTLSYTIHSADLLCLDYTDADVRAYDAALTEELEAAYPDAEIAVSVVARVSGSSPVRVHTDGDENESAIEDDVRYRANRVFSQLFG